MEPAIVINILFIALLIVLQVVVSFDEARQEKIEVEHSTFQKAA